MSLPPKSALDGPSGTANHPERLAGRGDDLDGLQGRHRQVEVPRGIDRQAVAAAAGPDSACASRASTRLLPILPGASTG